MNSFSCSTSLETSNAPSKDGRQEVASEDLGSEFPVGFHYGTPPMDELDAFDTSVWFEDRTKPRPEKYMTRKCVEKRKVRTITIGRQKYTWSKYDANANFCFFWASVAAFLSMQPPPQRRNTGKAPGGPKKDTAKDPYHYPTEFHYKSTSSS